MREVLRRRLQRAADGDEKFLPLPDIFLIDGGVTHAAAVLEVAQAFGVRGAHLRHGEGRPPPHPGAGHPPGARRSAL